MKRRQFLELTFDATAIAALFPQLLTASPKSEGKKNVLFIVVDDLRPELSCYGAKHIHSPNIDKLAASGTLLKRAYCQQAVRNPSRASLMTGLRPDSSGVLDLPTHFRDKVPDVITLPKHFMNNGGLY